MRCNPSTHPHYAVLHHHKSAFYPPLAIFNDCNERFVNKRAQIDEFGVLISHLK